MPAPPSVEMARITIRQVSARDTINVSIASEVPITIDDHHDAQKNRPNAIAKAVVAKKSRLSEIRNAMMSHQSLPIGSKVTYVVATIPRVECKSCGLVRQIQIGLADHRRSYTHAFERFALELSKLMTIKDVASHLGVGWDKVKDIQKRYLQRHFSKPALKGVRRIGIDEICVGHGCRFMTLVLDLDSGAILFAGKGKKLRL